MRSTVLRLFLLLVLSAILIDCKSSVDNGQSIKLYKVISGGLSQLLWDDVFMGNRIAQLSISQSCAMSIRVLRGKFESGDKLPYECKLLSNDLIRKDLKMSAEPRSCRRIKSTSVRTLQGNGDVVRQLRPMCRHRKQRNGRPVLYGQNVTREKFCRVHRGTQIFVKCSASG